MRKNKKEFGITLVALIITIIILLLLAGITIGQLTGNGIFESAKTAKEQYENAQKEENDKILELANAIENQGVQSSSREDNVVLTQAQYNQMISDINTLKSQVQTLQQNSIRFVDYSNVIDDTTLKNAGATYTATQDCAIIGKMDVDLTKGEMATGVKVNGVDVWSVYADYSTVRNVLYIKNGDVVTLASDSGTFDLTVYGLKSATPTD